MSDSNEIDPLEIFRSAPPTIDNSMPVSGNVPDIYQYISEGKTIEMPFPCRVDAKNFYSTLSKFRTHTEDHQVSIAFISEQERLRISMKWNAATCTASFSTSPKQLAKTYSFVVKDKEK